MKKANIKKALEMLENYGGPDDRDKLILAVYETSPDVVTWNELAEVVADGRMEDPDDVKAELKDAGAKLGYLMRASHMMDYGLWEADHVFLFPDTDGSPYSYEHSGNVANVREGDFTLRNGAAVDQYGEMIPLRAAVGEILSR